MGITNPSPRGRAVRSKASMRAALVATACAACGSTSGAGPLAADGGADAYDGGRIPLGDGGSQDPPGGIPDPLFGSAGVRVLDDLGFTPYAVAIQRDGRIVLAGKNIDPTDTGSIGIVVRLTASGTPDVDFGTAGKVQMPSVSFRSLALQADGKIVVGGGDGGGKLVLSRFDSRGAPDTSFGVSGTVQKSGSTSVRFYGELFVDISGRIYGLGTADSRDAYGEIHRFDASGAAAPFASASILQASMHPNGMRVLADGRVTAIGTFLVDNGTFTRERLRVSRWLASGSRDTSFNATGELDLVFPPKDEAQGADLYAYPDGRLVLAGIARDSNESLLSVARLADNGSYDLLYGTGGFVLVRPPPRSISTFSARIALDAKDRAWVAAPRSGARDVDSSLVRISTTGAHETNFGVNGFADIDLGSDERPYGLALAADGSAVVAGGSKNTQGYDTHGFVARYLP